MTYFRPIIKGSHDLSIAHETLEPLAMSQPAITTKSLHT
jgi:hypothetical protein